MSHINQILSSSWLVHKIGDFLLQNSWMALNKKYLVDAGWRKNLRSLAIASTHGIFYTIPMIVVYLWNPINRWTGRDLLTAFLLWIVHLTIDYFNFGALWTRIYNADRRDWRKVDPSTRVPFWVCVEIDQTLHYITNVLILSIPYWSEWKEWFSLFS